jgi:hypothetical protein
VDCCPKCSRATTLRGCGLTREAQKRAKPRKLFPSRWFRRGLDTGFRFGAAGKRFVHKFGIPQLPCVLARQRGRRGRRSRGLGDGPFPQFLNCRLNSPDRGGRARRLAVPVPFLDRMVRSFDLSSSGMPPGQRQRMASSIPCSTLVQEGSIACIRAHREKHAKTGRCTPGLSAGLPRARPLSGYCPWSASAPWSETTLSSGLPRHGALDVPRLVGGGPMASGSSSGHACGNVRMSASPE